MCIPSPALYLMCCAVDIKFLNTHTHNTVGEHYTNMKKKIHFDCLKGFKGIKVRHFSPEEYHAAITW